jgi:hypothetical protein
MVAAVLGTVRSPHRRTLQREFAEISPTLIQPPWGMPMKLAVMLLAACAGVATSQVVWAVDEECDRAGAGRHIPLPRAVTLDGVLERSVETPICWSIRQNDGSNTQMVFFTRILSGLNGGQNPGPTVTLDWVCDRDDTDHCTILGTMDFYLRTFRQEDVNLRIDAYGPKLYTVNLNGFSGSAGSGAEKLFTLDSGQMHLDCQHDGPQKIHLTIDPRNSQRDVLSSRENFEAVTQIVVRVDRTDTTEGLCSSHDKGVLSNIATVVGKAADDAWKNIRGDYQPPPQNSWTGPSNRYPIGPITYGPYGQIWCHDPFDNPDVAPHTMQCSVATGYQTWWVCTGRSEG